MSNALQIYNKAGHLKIDANATPIERDLAGLVCALATEIIGLQDKVAQLSGRPNPPRNLGEGK